MSESSAPWRALEDGADVAAGAAGTTQSRDPTPVKSVRPWVMAAIGAAALMLGAAVVLAVTSGSGSVAIDGGSGIASQAPRASGEAAPAKAGPGTELVVDVQGAVLRPGIVRLPMGARVGDAITAAGGFGPRVAADRVGQALNLAAALRDGDQVAVPSRDDPSPSPGHAGGPGGTRGSGGSGPLDLNRATAAELDELPGVGPVTVAKIISAREEQPFATIDDLRTRKVLGEATLEKIRELVAVR